MKTRTSTVGSGVRIETSAALSTGTARLSRERAPTAHPGFDGVQLVEQPQEVVVVADVVGVGVPVGPGLPPAGLLGVDGGADLQLARHGAGWSGQTKSRQRDRIDHHQEESPAVPVSRSTRITQSGEA